MRVIALLATILLWACGDDFQHSVPLQPPADTAAQQVASKQGWVFVPVANETKKELEEQGFEINTLRTEESPFDSPYGPSVPTTGYFSLPGSGVYYSPTYTPRFANIPISYNSPALRPIRRVLNANNNNVIPFLFGARYGGVPGGVIGAFPGYGGVAAGGALPGANIHPGANLGGTIAPTIQPFPPTRILQPYFFGYYNYGPGIPNGYIGVPVSVFGNGSNARFQPRNISNGEPHPVILFVPSNGGYTPIVTFRGTT